MAHLWNVRISFHRCAFLFIYIESRHGFGNEFGNEFIYGMSMIFFSMMAFLFWRKGKEMLFRMIMWLMIVVDLQLVKDMVFFLIYGFDNEHAWYLTSSLDMMIIPFYSFVLMDLVKPGWFRWLKALMLELPFLLLPVFYIFTHNIIWFYVLSVWGAIYGC